MTQREVRFSDFDLPTWVVWEFKNKMWHQIATFKSDWTLKNMSKAKQDAEYFMQEI